MSDLPPPDLVEILRVLHRHHVEFVLVGGIAAVLLGAPITTTDIDVVYARDERNLERLLTALEELAAVYRGFEGRGVRPDAASLAGEGHHILTTRHGGLDVLAWAGQRRFYEDLIGQTLVVSDGDLILRVADLASQIRLKRETNRPKDRAMLPILEALARETGG